jgi:NAD-dependent deacetylase
MSGLEAARALVAGARRIAVLTGAGVSAESGIPTFRGPDGLWCKFRPEDLATPGAFERDPALVWEWYDWRRGLVAAAAPNPAHAAIARLEARRPATVLVTQNVDGLHALAGSPDPVELHGSLWRTRCAACAELREDRRVPLRPLPPRCPCGGLLRPDVVWFGEALPGGLLRRAVEAAESCDLMIVAGTSGLVQPAASLADVALSRGAALIEVNLDETPLSGRCAESFRARAGEILPQLLG